MTVFMNPTTLGLAAACLLMSAPAAQAQSMGGLSARLSVTRITPDVASGDLSAPSFAGTQIDIQSNTQLTGGLTWTKDDHLAFDLPLSTGFKHNIMGAGAISGTGKIGETKALPITALVQYRFMAPSATVRPYLGLGPTYAKFFKERSTLALTGLTGGSASNPTTLHIDSKFGFTAQVGVSVALAPKWSLDLAALKTLLKTQATLSTGQTISATLNPMSLTAGVAYQF